MAVWTERILQSRLQTKGNEEISRKCVHSHESILIDSTEAKQKLEWNAKFLKVRKQLIQFWHLLLASKMINMLFIYLKPKDEENHENEK